jgi:hypothetical protein
LSILVTSDPVAEIDAALADAGTRLREARAAGRDQADQALAEWIDIPLDERLTFRSDTAAVGTTA